MFNSCLNKDLRLWARYSRASEIFDSPLLILCILKFNIDFAFKFLQNPLIKISLVAIKTYPLL